MRTYNDKDIERALTPWGEEVLRQLREQKLTQTKLCEKLKENGIDLPRNILGNLIFGISCRLRWDAIKKINELLGIPFETNEGD